MHSKLHCNSSFFLNEVPALDWHEHPGCTSLAPLDSYQCHELYLHDLRFTHAYFFGCYEFHLLCEECFSFNSVFDWVCLFFSLLLLSFLALSCSLFEAFSVGKVYFAEGFSLFFLLLVSVNLFFLLLRFAFEICIA